MSDHPLEQIFRPRSVALYGVSRNMRNRSNQFFLRGLLDQRFHEAAPLYLVSPHASEIAGLRVVSRDTLDGHRFTLEGGWWLLLRFSGTEPLLRVYAELPSPAQVRQAIEHGQALAGVTL